jgi:retron-type reverse transcriptase
VSEAASRWQEITGFRNLLRASRRAAVGKRGSAGVARFLFRLEPELLALQRALIGGAWRPGAPFTFEISDPKPRTIAAAPFRDRVVHHALIDVLESDLDRAMVAQSFACRRGKGTHRALAQAQRLVRQCGWFLKLDVHKCFPSMDHAVVLDTLRRAVGDADAMALCATIVQAGGEAGCGLPIGNLTSQWFANLVLDRLDRHVLVTLRPRGYVRYMDDFVLFDDAKERLQAMHGEIAAFLQDTLRLRLKERATILAPVRAGLPFLGFRVYRGLLRLRPQNLRRTRARLRQRARQLAAGTIDERQYASSAAAVVAHLRHGNTLRLRRTLFAKIAARVAADPTLRQPRQPRRQLRQRAVERAVGQPQQERTFDPQRQPGLAPRQDVSSPDRAHRHAACARRAP